MKPLRLTIEGIKSFAQLQTVDFTELGKNNIFVISGITGAGKTTVLDCIILALYGGRKGDNLNLDEYINLKTDKAEAALDFETETGGNVCRYRVTRTLNRGKKGNKATLSDLNTGTVLVEGGDKVTQAIESMIGLNSDSFTKVVILEQGRYSEFLKATKKNRTELVGSLFKLERYGNLYKRASQKYREVSADIEVLDEYFADKKALTKGGLNEKKKRLKTVEKEEKELIERIKTLSGLREEFRRAFDAYNVYTQAVKASETAKKTLDENIAKLTEFESAQKDFDGGAALTELTEKLASARQKKAALEAQRESVAKLRELDESIRTMLDKHKTARENIAFYEKEIAAAEKTIAEMYAEIDMLCRSAESYGVTVPKDCTEAALMKIIGEYRLKNAAAAIESKLEEGDICPVCGGTVTAKHALHGNVGFDNGIKILENLTACVVKKEGEEKKKTELSSEAEKTAVAADGIVNEGKALRQAQASLKSQLFEPLGDVGYDVAVKSVGEEVKELEEKYAALKKAVDESDTVHKRLISEKSAALGAFESCTENEKRLKCEKPDDKQREACEKELALAEEGRTKTVSEKSTLAVSIENDERELKIKREKENEKRELAARRDRLQLLMKMFYKDAFLEFISQEYIEEFCMDASEHLARMSGGWYTLGYDADEAEFFVMDFRAGNMKRSVRTLSGGETFLASLSLAIAVSRAIAEKNSSGLKFDFLFLDEGFGTLHEDAIGVVERALRTLSKDTLVGIVTHRTELTELIYDKLIVERATESEGSKVHIVS